MISGAREAFDFFLYHFEFSEFFPATTMVSGARKAVHSLFKVCGYFFLIQKGTTSARKAFDSSFKVRD
jgi:hypothetical protein